jgi:hypothetical protein
VATDDKQLRRLPRHSVPAPCHPPVNELVEGLWGAEVPRPAPARRAPNLLLRTPGDAELPVDILSSSRSFQLLVDPATVDVSLFRESLRAARRAREGGDLAVPALELRDGLGAVARSRAGRDDRAVGPRGPVAGMFFEARRAWLGQLHATALNERMEIDIKLGGHAGVAAEQTAAVMEQPYREQLWELLMLAP